MTSVSDKISSLFLETENVIFIRCFFLAQNLIISLNVLVNKIKYLLNVLGFCGRGGTFNFKYFGFFCTLNFDE